jgi:hypothetical protein
MLLTDVTIVAKRISVGGAMTRIAFAAFIGIALAGAGAFAACPGNPPKSHPAKKREPADSCVNLSAVPQISATIVAAEPAPAAKTSTYSDPTPAHYQGPTLGMSKPDPGVRPIPTIGYHWSLE